MWLLPPTLSHHLHTCLWFHHCSHVFWWFMHYSFIFTLLSNTFHLLLFDNFFFFFTKSRDSFKFTLSPPHMINFSHRFYLCLIYFTYDLCFINLFSHSIKTWFIYLRVIFYTIQLFSWSSVYVLSSCEFYHYSLIFPWFLPMIHVCIYSIYLTPPPKKIPHYFIFTWTFRPKRSLFMWFLHILFIFTCDYPPKVHLFIHVWHVISFTG